MRTDTCKNCHIEKHISEFNKDYQNKKGYKSICKDCTAKQQQELLKKQNYQIKCIYCNQWKTLSHFRKNKHEKLGYFQICKSCSKQKVIDDRIKFENSSNPHITCRVCKKTKHYSEFKISYDNKTGYKTICEACEIEKQLKEQQQFTEANKQIKCRGCNKIQPLSQFYKDRTAASGYDNLCKTCIKQDEHQKAKQLVQRQREFQKNNDIIVCNKCEKEKPLSEFYRNNQTVTGFYRSCKSCMKLYAKERQRTFHAKTIKCKN